MSFCRHGTWKPHCHICRSGREIVKGNEITEELKDDLVLSVCLPPEDVAALHAWTMEKDRQIASLLAQVKAWEDKAGEVQEEPIGYAVLSKAGWLGCWRELATAEHVVSRGKESGETIYPVFAADLSAALVVARKENEGLKEWAAYAKSLEGYKALWKERATAAEAESADIRGALDEAVEMTRALGGSMGDTPTGKTLLEVSARWDALLAPRREKEQQQKVRLQIDDAEK